MAFEPVFDAFDRSHGLQSTTVLEVISDPHGFVWVAGDRGVQRFDGHNFFNLDRDPNRPDTLESRFIYSLAASNDAMWIGSPNGSLQRLDSHTGKLTNVPLKVRGISPHSVQWIACDALGQLWQMSDRGLVRLDRRGDAAWVMRQSFDAMAFNPERTKLFVATADLGVVEIDTRDPNRISTLLTLPKGSEGPITAMASDPKGLWLAAGRNLWRFDRATGSTQRVAMPSPFLRATALVVSKDGVVWLGSVFDDGLYRYDPNASTLSVFRNEPSDPQSLRPGFISTLAIDRSNNLWIGLGTSGLSRLRLGQTASHYRLKGGERVSAISEVESRGLIVSLYPGGVMEVDRESGQLRPLPASSALPEVSRAIVGDRQGGLWITSAREGLFHWRPDGSVHRFPLREKSGRPAPVMTGAYLDGAQRLWVSHLNGLAVLEPGANELRIVEAHEGAKPYALGITHDVSPGPNGSLWLGTVTGLVNLQPGTGQIRRYAHDRYDNTSLSDDYVLQAYTDKAGRLWVGTRAGLDRLTIDRNGRTAFKRFGLDDGLPDITIEAIMEDGRGGLWVATNRGIARWDPLTDHFQSYLPADGIPDIDVYMKSALLGADGGLYLGTLNGLWRFDPRSIRIADPVPLILSSYEAGDRTIVNLEGKGLSNIKVGYNDSRIAFRVAVLGDSRRLSYRLDGLDDDWRDMPDNLTLAYHWLSPGSYRLLVRQLQRDGTWGGPDLSLPVQITPPLWRTGWAYFLYSLLAVGALIGVSRAFMAWRHRALHEQLKESHARLSVALQAARFGMWAWDPETGEAELDSDAGRMLSVPAGIQPATGVLERVHPDDIGRVSNQIGCALDGDLAADFEFRLAADGASSNWQWIEGHVVPYQRPGKSAYVIGVARDATQRKRELAELAESKQAAERAFESLVRSRHDLAMALESGELGVWHSELFSARPTGDRTWTRDLPVECDANVLRILGLSDGRRITRGQYLRAIHPLDRKRVLERLFPVLTEGGSYADEYRIVQPGGQVRSIAVRAASVPHADPSAGAAELHLTGIVHDITSEEALKADLKQAAEEAQLATETKGRFLAMMSHEIRTPINGVIGMVELLSESPMTEEQQQLLAVCKDSAYMLLAIINDILDFSKIEAGRMKLEYTQLSLRRLVESVAESFRTQVVRKGIDLDVFVASEVPRRLIGDRVRLRQVLTNLIGNAVKFTESGGVRIYVSLDGVAQGGQRFVRIDIVDTGIGMDRQTLEELFQPFQQADATTTRRFGGTGLGLAIVKHLATLMGGRVECDSVVSAGSRFSLVVPLETASMDGGRKDHAFADVRVVALCESRERAHLLRDLANDLGPGIEIMASVDELMQRLRRIDDAGRKLVLLDKGFSDDQEAICKIIRSHAGISGIPIIAVRSDSGLSTKSAAHGVTVVAGNPLTCPVLARGISLALGLASPTVPPVAMEQSGDVLPQDPASDDAMILLAEDNATNREVITHQLKRLGYICEVAEDGEQAWEKLQANRDRYQLLLTDCHMPRLDGYGLTERIRRDEEASGKPRLNIVAITANALLGEGERCLALGMDAFLAKPLQMSDLKRVLMRMLPVRTQPRMADSTVSSPTDVDSGFAEFASLVGNDKARLKRVLDVFMECSHLDLQKWMEARRHLDREELIRLAHKLKSGCRQLGERSAATAFEAVEQHRGTASELEAIAELAQSELERTLERVQAFQKRLDARLS